MDRWSRILVLTAALILLSAVFGFQAVTASAPGTGATTNHANATATANDTAPYPGNTLITVQDFGWFGNDNGQAFIVNRSGGVVWRYDPPNSRVFDGQMLSNGHVLLSVATKLPADQCQAQYLQIQSNSCVENHVIELNRSTNDVVWNYTWYDQYIEHHEVHDAERLPNGQTAIIDMGNNRAFTVNEAGKITWQWNATAHIGPGTSFWKKYVPADAQDNFRKKGPESDWTHMNAITKLQNGDFQLSIRNFDVVVDVNPKTNRIDHVIGQPGNHTILNHQHDPMPIEHAGTVLVPDSENNRIVELYTSTNAIVWSYDGTGSGEKLQWPRDADRLPNGDTLIADSRNFRVLEINRTGHVVWQYNMQDSRGIVYDADRIGTGEEPQNVPGGANLSQRVGSSGTIGNTVSYVDSWAGFVFPPWMKLPEILTLFAVAVVAVWLAVELAVLGWTQWRSGDADVQDRG